MPGIETTALTVEFTEKAFSSSDSIVMERSNKEPDDNDYLKDSLAFFRVHGADGHTIVTTSGRVFGAYYNLRKYVSEFVYFNGEKSSSLKYPNALSVRITPYGKFYDTNGDGVDATVTMNVVKNALEASSAIYGVILAEYEAPYDLWRAEFGGRCPSVENVTPPVNSGTGSEDDDRAYEGLDPMVVYAWKAGNLEASLALDPPPCRYASGGATVAKAQMNAGSERLIIQIDPENPVQYTGTQGSIEAGASLLVFPADANASVKTTSGTIQSRTDQGTVTVEEMLTFSNSSSVRLSFPPDASSIHITREGGFQDTWGRSFRPELKKWGDSVTSVNWISKFSYDNPISRTVDRSEIVTTSGLNKVMACYGTASVKYQTTYDVRKFSFEYDSDREVFYPASILAEAGDMSGFLYLTPPSSEGFV